MKNLLTKVFGTKHERDIKKLMPLVAAINRLEPEMETLSDSGLRERFDEYRRQVQERLAPMGEEERGLAEEAEGDTTRLQNLKDAFKRKRREIEEEVLLEVLPPVFALVREASRRTTGLRHFDVQLIGGRVLHDGKISEMKTGEGKTLVATLPAALNALVGRGVHIVTVNDYLAKRDAEWMGPIYKTLGMSVGVIVHGRTDAERKAAYGADITYGTNNEFGFDYLRDNMKFDLGELVQRGHFYGIVDEVDSILIDEARTPLIISGPSEESTDLYYRVDRIIPKLSPSDFTLDEKHRSVALSEDGVGHVEKLLGVDNLYDPVHMETLHHVQQALRAHVLYKRDKDYIVKDGEVLIIDEFTGRQMPGRRWSDGLHQAVEAKEGVKIERENQTLATITFQNYIRMYKKLSGMTGTADTEAAEFAKIYNLDVMVIPPNRAMIRSDDADVVYRTEGEKFAAIVEELVDCHQRGQPVLVGTISIEKSERLSSLLKKQGVKHAVLNAKFHEKEAEIIAQAGRKGTVTIATNMAGRGTDILLGGNPEFLFKQAVARDADLASSEHDAERARLRDQLRGECESEKEQVVALGGLHIIGTERHESRRIDNQLRGRAGRQGDPGSSRFYLSLKDDLLRIFGSDRISGIMAKLGMDEGQPIEHSMITKAIENAQRKVEAHNFEIRKHLLEYDDVMNKQREVIYTQRRDVLESDDIHALVEEMYTEVLEGLFTTHVSADGYVEDWDLTGLTEAMLRQYGVHEPLTPESVADFSREALFEHVCTCLKAHYVAKMHDSIGEEHYR